jgi:hypothetical protein
LGFGDFDGSEGQPIKNIAANLSAGVDHIFLFWFFPYGGCPGMLNHDGVTERALHYRTAAELLNKATFVKKQEDANLRAYTFKCPNGTMTVAWARTNQAQLTLKDTPEKIIDRFGNDLPVTGKSVVLTQNPVFIRMSR